MSEASSESPYGPASPVDALAPPAATPLASPVLATPEPAWVARGHRVLLLAVVITGGISALLLIGLIVMIAFGRGPANNNLTGLEDTITWIMVFGSPVLFVIALNLLVWRLLLRALSRMSQGGRVALIAGVGLALVVVSVIAVVLLLSFGFFIGLIIGGG